MVTTHLALDSESRMHQASKIGGTLVWRAMVDMFKTLRIERNEPSGPSQGMFIAIPSRTS